MENNKLIAEFMGYKYETGVSLGGSWGRFFKIGGDFDESFPVAKYDTSWDWLMPVVEKIESLGYFCMINKWTSVYTGSDGERISVTSVEGESKSVNTYQAVIAFIEWYNKRTIIEKIAPLVHELTLTQMKQQAIISKAKNK